MESDKTPQVRNGESGDWIGSFLGHKGAVWSAKIDALTRTLALTASGDFTAKLWCCSTGKELFEFSHPHIVRSVDFSHVRFVIQSYIPAYHKDILLFKDTLRIATGCHDGLVRVYQTASPESEPLKLKIADSTVINTYNCEIFEFDTNIYFHMKYLHRMELQRCYGQQMLKQYS